MVVGGSVKELVFKLWVSGVSIWAPHLSRCRGLSGSGFPRSAESLRSRGWACMELGAPAVALTVFYSRSDTLGEEVAEDYGKLMLLHLPFSLC